MHVGETPAPQPSTSRFARGCMRNFFDDSRGCPSLRIVVIPFDLDWWVDADGFIGQPKRRCTPHSRALRAGTLLAWGCRLCILLWHLDGLVLAITMSTSSCPAPPTNDQHYLRGAFAAAEGGREAPLCICTKHGVATGMMASLLIGTACCSGTTSHGDQRRRSFATGRREEFVRGFRRCAQIEDAIECGQLRCESTNTESGLGWASVPASRWVLSIRGGQPLLRRVEV